MKKDNDDTEDEYDWNNNENTGQFWAGSGLASPGDYDNVDDYDPYNPN